MGFLCILFATRALAKQTARCGLHTGREIEKRIDVNDQRARGSPSSRASEVAMRNVMGADCSTLQPAPGRPKPADPRGGRERSEPGANGCSAMQALFVGFVHRRGNHADRLALRTLVRINRV